MLRWTVHGAALGLWEPGSARVSWSLVSMFGARSVPFFSALFFCSRWHSGRLDSRAPPMRVDPVVLAVRVDFFLSTRVHKLPAVLNPPRNEPTLLLPVSSERRADWAGCASPAIDEAGRRAVGPVVAAAVILIPSGDRASTTRRNFPLNVDELAVVSRSISLCWASLKSTRQRMTPGIFTRPRQAMTAALQQLTIRDYLLIDPCSSTFGSSRNP